ncbi:MAG: hypothetical protein QOE83_1578 [Actinomycetota bacterium]|jgi:hypothetical protein|nr:hypothetical protein [Actinomycetota bacterium]
MTGALPAGLYEFAKFHPEAEGIIQHVGRETWDLILVDHTGVWVRGEFSDAEAARAACDRLKLRIAEGWGDPRMARWMNAKDHWNSPEGQRRAL